MDMLKKIIFFFGVLLSLYSCPIQILGQSKLSTIQRADILLKYNQIFHFEDHRAKVWSNELKVGYIDTDTGEEIIPCKYKYGTSFSNGVASVRDELGNSFLIDLKGNAVAKLDSTIKVETDFKEGMAIVSSTIDNVEPYGFIDRNGYIVIPCQYRDVSLQGFCDGLVSVKNRNNKYGYIDKTGKTIISFVFDSATDFYHGKAVVSYHNNYYIIDRMSNVTKELTGLYNVHKFTDGLARAYKNGKCGYVNLDGEVVVPFIYDMSPIVFRNGYASIKRDGLVGVIDLSGKVTSPIKYKSIMPFSKFGLTEAYINDPDIEGEDLCGVIDANGNIIVPFTYFSCSINDDLELIKARTRDSIYIYDIKGRLIKKVKK